MDKATFWKLGNTYKYPYKGKLRRIKIDVTQDDIDNGILGTDTHCPLALAAKRKLTFVLVSSTEFGVGYSQFIVYTKLSKIAENFVRRFDARKLVKPRSFYFYAPVEAIKHESN